MIAREDGRVLFSDERARMPAAAGPLRLFLSLTSHSNYPMRAVAFDDVRFERLR